jgi:PPOX class probable F420-dependent enzyme
VPDFPESHRDLLDAPVGILSTVGDTGIPQTTAIWFLHDEDGELKSWLSDARQKVKNLQQRPEYSFFILDTANPARYLTVRGRAELTPDPECVFGDRLGRKYNADVRAMLREDETRYVVTFRALKVLVR